MTAAAPVAVAAAVVPAVRGRPGRRREGRFDVCDGAGHKIHVIKGRARVDHPGTEGGQDS